jgi:GNAT superfamily N-acetyltransferase
MGISIRPLSADDEARWRELWAGYLDFYEKSLAPEVTAVLWQRLLVPATDPHGLGATDEQGQLVGIVHYRHQPTTWLIGDCIYLEDLYVDPSIRRSGAGRALIEGVYGVAAAEGITEVYWLTQEFNHVARTLYDAVAKRTSFIKYTHAVSDVS